MIRPINHICQIHLPRILPRWILGVVASLESLESSGESAVGARARAAKGRSIDGRRTCYRVFFTEFSMLGLASVVPSFT